MQMPSKASVKEAAKSPWIGVLLALIGLAHARIDLEKQKQINEETVLKARLLAKTSDSISSTADSNGKILQDENQRLRAVVAALAAYTAANGRKLDDALGVSSADTVPLPAGVTLLDSAPATAVPAPPETVARPPEPQPAPATAQPAATPPAANAPPAISPAPPAVQVPAKVAQKVVEGLAAQGVAPQVRLRQMPRLLPKADRDADGVPSGPQGPEQTDRDIKF